MRETDDSVPGSAPEAFDTIGAIHVLGVPSDAITTAHGAAVTQCTGSPGVSSAGAE